MFLYGFTSSVFVADVRKSPDIAQIDGESDDGQEKFGFLGPRFPAGIPAMAADFGVDDAGVDGSRAADTSATAATAATALALAVTASAGGREEDHRLRFLIICRREQQAPPPKPNKKNQINANKQSIDECILFVISTRPEDIYLLMLSVKIALNDHYSRLK